MPPLPARKLQLVEAAIHEIGTSGSLNVTVGQIAKRAGVSAALAFHYFGDKDHLFLAAMRYVLTIYGAEVRGALAGATSRRGRLEGVIRASFSATNFRSEVIASWLNFYVMAQRSTEARRLLSIYHRRLKSNLAHDLRPLAGDHAPDIAERLGGLIDGIYLRFAVNPGDTTGEHAADHVLAALDYELKALS
ncbi:transcriptional regulator, BetI [Pseudooceanicola batsensis HTCC2597]|uniref:HTH-type transcriptional regulator BetI n=1 Tax=Pseudooceanicola batsensis (strain ATCC BAA-863 / DSM 15984 / KCTC 12145 / HTCC2597) TaxID=252305 RepID=A3TUT0_PSEBH|nr:transcriptional regulator BetI [Pseudooceanicola batsensis]EAQ04276.1 transcriptional regulator, BetI [Pseudooceanicola batsensis HTCC2597]